jgi:alpha-2-macroglobulin
VAGDGPARGFRVVDVMAAAERAPEPLTKPGITVEYRNIGQVDVKVYPVDLMQLYLTRRNLNGIASIDLAGVTPLVEKTVALGDGADYDDKSKSIDLPLTKEGAYLTMIRGDNLYASGIVLVSPLEMEVLEEGSPLNAGPGAVSDAVRVRVTVRDARTKELLPKVQVKVIGSATHQFISGETDLRGVFVAEGVGGLITAVARRGNAQYAFYRGTNFLGGTEGESVGKHSTFAVPQPAARPVITGTAGSGLSPANQAGQSLDANIKMQNTANSFRQIERLQQRFAQPADKAKGAQAGGFR